MERIAPLMACGKTSKYRHSMSFGLKSWYQKDKGKAEAVPNHFHVFTACRTGNGGSSWVI